MEAAEGFAFDYENYDYPALTQTVSATRTSMPLSGMITVSERCSWILSRDIEGAQTIATKNISLAVGHNLYYVTVWFNESYNMVYILDVYRLGYRDYSFVDWGNYVSESTVEESNSISAPKNDPTHEGYTFVGWSVDSKIVSFPYALNENTTFEAEFTANDYVVSYDVGEGAPLAESTVTATYDAIFTPALSTRTGYIFDGWANKYETVKDPFAWKYAEDMSFVALWTAIDYAITYDFGDKDSVSKAKNNNANPATYTIEDGIAFAAPTRAGYIFTGWDIDQIDVGSYGELTVSANWAIINYDIIYDITVPELSVSKSVDNTANPTTYTVEDEVIFTTPIRSGYTSVWDIPSIAKGTTGSKYITVCWNAISYSITYYLDGGTNTESNPLSYTIESAVAFASPTRSGYTFDGWYTENNFANSISGVVTGNTGSVSAYAKWVYYTVNTGTNISAAGSYTRESDTKVTAGDSVTLTATTNIGYSWIGWYDGATKVSEGTELTYTFEMPKGNKTYTAKWELLPEMSNFIFSSTESTCIIVNVIDKTITSVTVPDYVTDIENSAFSGCSSLESMTIPFVGGSKSAMSASRSTLFGYIFGASTYAGGSRISQYYKTYYDYYIPSVLRSVTVTGGVIMDGAFRSCWMLTSVTIPSSVTSIREDAFKNCTGLASITIPDSVTRIGDRAFLDCNSLTSITIGSGVTSIGSMAFQDCNNLTEIYYTGDVAGWCGIYNLKELMLYGNCSKSIYFGGVKITDLVIPSGVTDISHYAFRNIRTLTSVSIPLSVTSIGIGAFSNCTGLTSITYQGTKAQWNGISKGEYWDSGTGAYTITCTDGNLSK